MANKRGVTLAAIVVLDQLTAGQIAAGEVVERPVSAVKELVENALDAGATRITVDLTDGGLSRIVVTDNGSGITPEDAGTAFLRHATSKIKNAADLQRVSTLGFRGEALPSIAAVAKVEMTTRTPAAATGVCVRLQGGSAAEVSAVGCAAGTRVEIRDLYYNTPVRRKSMKSPAAEGGLCGELLSKIAFSRPEVRFDFLTGGRRVFYTPGSGKLEDVLAAVYGAGQAKEMLPVRGAAVGLALNGFVGGPALSRSTRNHQTIIINGRYVRSPLVTAVVEREYRSLLSAGRRPVFVLALTVDADKLDVNVHPAKLEVRLLEERRVAALITEALSKALRGDAVIPSALAKQGEGSRRALTGADGAKPAPTAEPAREQLRLDFPERESVAKGNGLAAPVAEAAPGTSEGLHLREAGSVWAGAEPGRPESGGGTPKAASPTTTSTNPPAARARVAIGSGIALSPVGDAALGVPHGSLPAGSGAGSSQTWGGAAPSDGGAGPDRKLPKLYPLAQLLPTYILAEGEDGLYIIDQHAAHERVLYEECLAGRGDYPSQYLLVPETLELDHHEAATVTELLAAFSQAGFVLEPFGGNTFLLRGAPSFLPAGLEKELFRDLLDYYKEQNAAPEPEEFFKRLAASIACKGAVKAGEKMPYKTMETLLERLARTAFPFTCPHGRPTVLHLSHRDLRARFKR